MGIITIWRRIHTPQQRLPPLFNIADLQLHEYSTGLLNQDQLSQFQFLSYQFEAAAVDQLEFPSEEGLITLPLTTGTLLT